MSNRIYLFSTSSHPDAISINSLDITFLKPEIDFSNYDYFIITSKQSSQALKQYNPELLKPALCISKVTADSYGNIGGEILKVGTGYGDDLSLIIKEYPKSLKWLYVRAKTIASDFALVCKEDGYNIDEAIMYESQCSNDIKNVKVDDNSTLIFTSPSSVNCFLQNYEINKSFKIIVIGKTTAGALPKNIKYELPLKPTIEACLQLV